ncbi:MAG: hypothetical protein AAF376_15480 [Pseudomonadota bacterium]
MLRISLCTCLTIGTLTACGPTVPQLESQLTPPARGTDFPSLLPLQPLLADADAILLRNAAQEGTALQARGEDLRRRAAALRALEP